MDQSFSDVPIRVILIDDHRYVHQTIVTLLNDTPDIVLVGQGVNGQEAITLCERLQPDIVLMDVVMPVMDGIETTQLLQQTHPQIKVLVLSSFQDHESVYTMLNNGAAGYLTKDALTHDLVATIRTTYQGNMVLAPEIAAKLLQQQQRPLSPLEHFHLTDRELEVLVLMASGQTMKQIADELVISSSTVKFHINNILSKLGVETRAEALIVAAKNNLV